MALDRTFLPSSVKGDTLNQASEPNYALQDLKSNPYSSSEASSASHAVPSGFAHKVAVRQPVQPVLQNPGYGSSGGVQVTYRISPCPDMLLAFSLMSSLRPLFSTP
jgi:hypothetical protein